LASSASPSPIPPPATGSEDSVMTLDYTLAGLVTVVLLVYLTYALVRPERF
jgi:K+-transporting ATPase KdpF subunit